jgi:hypothetical protein
VEYDELASKQLPYYTVQKDVDNGISCFANAPDDAYGQAIPILYGTSGSFDLTINKYTLWPTVRISNFNVEYIATSHICTVVGSSGLYKYIESADTVMVLSGAASSYINSRRGYKYSLNNRAQTVLGEIFIQPKINVGDSYADIGEEAFDDNLDTYDTIAIDDTVAFQLGSKVTNSDLGDLSGVATDVNFYILWSSDDVYTQTIKMQLFNPNLIGGSTGYRTGFYEDLTDSTIKSTHYSFGNANYDYGANPRCASDVSTWDLDELRQQYFTVWNKNTNSAAVRIYNAYLHIQNIKVFIDPRQPSHRFGLRSR